MKAGILDSSMRIMENEHCSNTYYFAIKVNSLFNYMKFMEGTKHVLKELPKLRSHFQKGIWRDYWDRVEEDYDSFFVKQEVDIAGEEEADLDKAFMLTKNKSLKWGIDHPVKFTYYKGNTKGLLVIAIHHTLCDGQQSLNLISLIVKSYKAVKENRSITIGTSKGNPAKQLVKSYGKKNLLKTFRYMKPEDCIKDTKSILEKEVDYQKEIDRDRIVTASSRFSRSDLEKMKQQFPQKDITLNDIFLCCGLKVADRFNKEKNVNNKAVLLSYNVNLRRYIDNAKEQGLVLTNMFAPQSLVHDLKNGSSYDSIMNTVRENKSIPIGLPFYSMIHMMRVFSIVFVEKMVGGILNEVNSKVYQGFSITNVGRIDSYFEKIKDEIEGIHFIPTGGKTGFPSVSIFEYKGEFSFSFSKYHDEEGLTSKVQQYYEEELRKLMKECNVYEN